MDFLETIAAKQQALANLVDGIEKIRAAIPYLGHEEQFALTEFIQALANGEHQIAPNTHLPSPTEAITAFFKSLPNSWLTSGDVVDGVAGKFKTTSAYPAKVVYSTIKALVDQGIVKKSDDGRYRIAAKEME
jgi:hypothetical protein